MAGVFPPLFATTSDIPQKISHPQSPSVTATTEKRGVSIDTTTTRLSPSLSPLPSPISPIPLSASKEFSQRLCAIEQQQQQQKQRKDHLYKTTPSPDKEATDSSSSSGEQDQDDFDTPTSQQLHCRPQPSHSRHPLNQLPSQQRRLVSNSSYNNTPGGPENSSQHHKMMPVIDLWEQQSRQQHQKYQRSLLQHYSQEQQQQQQPPQQHQNQPYLQQIPPERRFVLSSPARFTRSRKSSADSVGGSVSDPDNSSCFITPNNNGGGGSRHGRNRSSTGGDEMMTSTFQRGGSFLQQPDPLQETPVIRARAGGAGVGGGGEGGSKYEVLLKQIAAQRVKLNALNAGAQTLTKEIAVLDETLGEENDSREAVLQEATRAVDGWGQTWTAYAKCEPVEVLQERPNALASLIQGMSWEDKKELFVLLVGNCRPRETYQLQHQLSVQHGQVYGFDLLEEFSSDISTLVLKNLSFADLASCRSVSRVWRQKAMVYDVLMSAMDRLTYSDDTIDMDRRDDERKNWNQLCRYQERNLRWKHHKPASVHPMMGHTSYVTSLKDRGEWIISGGYDEKVRLWEAATGKCVKIWEVDSAVSCVELLVDANMEGGGVVVAAFVDIGLVKVWSLHGPLNMYTLTGHQKGVRALAINESYLVTAGFDQTVLVWNWSTGRRVASFRAHNEVILGVHLMKNTVFTFCIDATLRVFDVPSRTLLHQVKLFEVQQGSSLQWSCLQDKMFLTATNRKVYVWQMEHLESLVQQQQHQQQQHQRQQQMLLYRSPSAVSLASSSDMGSEQHFTPSLSTSQTPLGSTPSSSLTNPTLQPDTPASSSSSVLSSISTGSTYFNLVVEGFGASVETRVKPCLTAVLTLANDMWCGKVTHHDPPLLLIGSRSSQVKLSVVPLTTDIIDPSNVYDNDYTPLQVAPKSWPFQGMPTGNGRGVMCIDSSSGRLVVGCTGGSIHVLNMDPAKRNLATLRSSAAAMVVTLPHLTPTQMDSIRSVSPVNPPLPHTPASIMGPKTMTTVITMNTGFPRKPAAVFRSTTNTNISSYNNSSSNVIGRPGVITLPSPDRSPTHIGGMKGGSPPRASSWKTNKMPTTPQSDYEEQEVLLDSYDSDISREFSDGDLSMISSLDFSFKSLSSSPPEESKTRIPKETLKPLTTTTTGKSGSAKSSSPTSPTSRVVGGQKSGTTPSTRRASTPNTTGSGSSYTSQTLSSLSKFIPSSPSKMMMRRRANSAAWTQQVTTTVTTKTEGAPHSVNTSLPTSSYSPVSILMKGRNRSDPNILGSAHHATSETTAQPKSVAKSWSLPSPWHSPSRTGSKK